MKNMKDNFRKMLLESEHINPELKEKYNREVHMLFEKKLTGPRKWFTTAMIFVMLGMAIFFLYATIISHGLPFLARASFGIGVIFALAFAAHLFSVVRKGSFNEKKDSNVEMGIVWGFLIIMITLDMIIAGNMNDQVRGIALVLNGLVFFNIFGVVGMLQYNINQAQLKTQEKLLEIEFCLAEMKEMLEKK